jgi:histidinol-phosphatase
LIEKIIRFVIGFERHINSPIMSLSKKHINEFLAFSSTLVKTSEPVVMKYFGKNYKPKLKENNTPVTIADLKCEELLISRIRKKYPSHEIYSEESGKTGKDSEFTWIIDPIDGTKNYIRKHPFWGILLALEHEGEIVLGIINMPALNEFIYASKGDGCYLNGRRIRVSKTGKLENSFCIFGGIDYILKQRYWNGFSKLAEMCDYNRGFGDCHGHSFVMKGQAEFMIDPHVAPYDVAATKICIEEAGGAFTDTKGNVSIYNGDALISNGKVHEKVLRILNG